MKKSYLLCANNTFEIFFSDRMREICVKIKDKFHFVSSLNHKLKYLIFRISKNKILIYAVDTLKYAIIILRET